MTISSNIIDVSKMNFNLHLEDSLSENSIKSTKLHQNAALVNLYKTLASITVGRKVCQVAMVCVREFPAEDSICDLFWVRAKHATWK